MKGPTKEQYAFMIESNMTYLGVTMQGRNNYAIETTSYQKDDRILYRLDLHENTHESEELHTVFAGTVPIKGEFRLIETYAGDDPIEMSKFLNEMQHNLGPNDDIPKRMF